MGGFSETSTPGSHRNQTKPLDADDEWRGEDIELVFDDPNITRTAFE